MAHLLKHLAQYLTGSLFECRHNRRTWPLSRINGRQVPPYETCLDCGAELGWIGFHEPRRTVAADLAVAEERA